MEIQRTPDRMITSAALLRVVLHALVIAASVALGVWALYRLASVVLVVILAAMFAYVIAPLVHIARRPVSLAGRRRRLSRGTAIAAVYLLIGVSVTGGVAALLPTAIAQANEVVARVPTYVPSIIVWQHGWVRYYERLRMPIALREALDRSVLAGSEAGLQYGRESLLALVGELSYVPWLVLVPVLAFFLLKDAPTLRRTVLAALPHDGQLRGHRLLEDLSATLAAYVRAQLLACLLVGALCGLGFSVLGVPYPVLLGVLAGALEFVPLVGPLLLAVVAATIAALHAPMLAVWALAFLGLLRLAQDYVIYPRLIRRGIHLHPLAVLLGVLSGADLAGVIGLFLAVPAIALASVVYRHGREWRRQDSGDWRSSSPLPPS
jgi:predicted PurR-regulated permease PerM